MKIKNSIVMVFVILVLLQSAANSHGTIFGTPGGILVPTAEVTKRGVLDLQLEYFNIAPFVGVDIVPENAFSDIEYEGFVNAKGGSLALSYSPFKNLDLNAAFFDFNIRSRGNMGGLPIYKKSTIGRIYNVKYVPKSFEPKNRTPAVLVGMMMFDSDGGGDSFYKGYVGADFNIGEKPKNDRNRNKVTHLVVGVESYSSVDDVQYILQPQDPANFGFMLAIYDESRYADDPEKRNGYFVEYASIDYLSRMQKALLNDGSFVDWANSISQSGYQAYLKEGKNNLALGLFTEDNGALMRIGLLLSNRSIEKNLDTNDDFGVKKPFPLTFFISGSLSF